MMIIQICLLVIILIFSPCLAVVPLHGQYSNGDSVPHSFLNVNILSDKLNIFRNDTVTISYNITSCGVNKIAIKFPDFFEDPVIIYDSKKYKRLTKNVNNIEIDFGGRSNVISENLSYRARIKKDMQIRQNNNIIIGKNTIDIGGEGIAEYPDIKMLSLSISNNNPTINSFKIERSAEFRNRDYPLFKGENLHFVLEVNDVEDKFLNYSLYKGDMLVSAGHDMNISSNKVITIPFITDIPCVVKILIYDKDGGLNQSEQMLSVESYTSSDYKAEKTLWKIFLILCISLLGFILRHFINFMHKKIAFVIFFIWPILIAVSFLDDKLRFFREISNFQVGLYYITFMYSAYFIESNFLTDNPENKNEQKNKFARFIKNLPNFGPDHKLWIVSTFSMFFIMLMMILCIPKVDLFINPESNISDKYNYIFWYYSMMPQTFGAILAVVVAFTGWYLADKTMEKGKKDKFKKKIKNFMILYMSIIILSVIGLVNSTIPPFDNLFVIITNWPNAISIITLQCTFLLIIPAFACLYELAKWTMELND